MHRLLLSSLVALSLLGACGDGDTADRTPSDSSSAAGSSASGTSATPAPSGGTTTGATDFEPIDPATGTMSLTAPGAQGGKRTFRDVNGSLTEQAGAGSTTMIMQLEGHDDPVHLRIRLLDDEEIRAGRYTIGSTDQGVDAAYENAGANYRSVGKATGTVELTKVTDDRAVGTYNLTLEQPVDASKTVTISGSFDMRVQK